MNIVDGIILLWLAISVFRGYRTGLLRQAASFTGFVVGVFIGGWIGSTFFAPAETSGPKLLIPLILVFGLGLLLSGIFEMLAAKVQHKIRLNLAQTLNAILGAVFSVGASFVLAWLLLSSMNRLPLANIGVSISESGIFRMMQKVMPPSPAVLGRINTFITPYGFPQIFVGDEPTAEPVANPVPAEVELAASQAREAVVRIEGYACGDITSGSGFIVAPGFVATNAHVLAGVESPVVVRGSEKFRTTPVWFDDQLDFAVLRVSGLTSPVLQLLPEAPMTGQSGAVLGYPGGGPLTVVPGVMQSRYTAVGRDIYGKNLVSREIYLIQSSIHPGNSGGPFVMPDGRVAGIMFGASTTQPTSSYAITSSEVENGLRQAMSEDETVTTGSCL